MYNLSLSLSLSLDAAKYCPYFNMNTCVYVIFSGLRVSKPDLPEGRKSETPTPTSGFRLRGFRGFRVQGIRDLGSRIPGSGFRILSFGPKI